MRLTLNPGADSRQTYAAAVIDDRQTQAAQMVNPEAGLHEITADPDLLAACERAIDTTYAAHPYDATRDADRGRRFSSSESGWLVTVAMGEGEKARGAAPPQR